VALTLPVTRDIVVSERRNYVLSYAFCDLGIVPLGGSIFAKAYAKFSESALFEGFIGVSAERPTIRFFSPGEKLYRNSGVTRKGRMVNDFTALLDYGVATEVKDADAPSLPNLIANGVLSITIPFGASFSRYVNPETGVMSRDDMYLPNDPARYYYIVMSGDTLIGSGTIFITIDLGRPPVDEEEKEPTVCSVKVT
jgi:hypothetical protein